MLHSDEHAHKPINKWTSHACLKRVSLAEAGSGAYLFDLVVAGSWEVDDSQHPSDPQYSDDCSDLHQNIETIRSS